MTNTGRCSNCFQSREAENYERAIKMAEIEGKADKVITIVFKLNGNYYGQCRSCWEKDGRVGEPILTIYPL